MISFHTDAITVLRAPLVDDPDYGNKVPDWPNAVPTTVTGCRVQPERGSEYTIDREAVLTRWRLFAPDTIDLLPTDRVRHDGVDYDIEGSVERWPSPTSALAHVEALLRRVEG